MIIKSDVDFFQHALRYYDNSACTSAEEFTNDIGQHQTIKRAIRKYIDDGANLHRLINHTLIFYNCFGKGATTMLIYKIKEDEFRGVLIPIICYLGWHDESLDALRVNINKTIIKDIEELFKG